MVDENKKVIMVNNDQMIELMYNDLQIIKNEIQDIKAGLKIIYDLIHKKKKGKK